MQENDIKNLKNTFNIKYIKPPTLKEYLNTMNT